MALRVPTAQAMQAECSNQQSLEHSFDSGATWSLCVDVNDNHGLTITSLRYRAPGDFSRSVLRRLHLGQLLLHYHDEPLAQAQIVAEPDHIIAELPSRTIAMNIQSCDAEILSTEQHSNAICSRIKDNPFLAKYAQRPSLHSQSWELSSAFQRNSHTWTTSVTLTEDGTIRPQLSLSGRLTRTGNDNRFASGPIGAANAQQQLVRATLLATWRVEFELDTSDPDRIEQFEFPLQTAQGNRRPMQVTSIDRETLSRVDPDTFRAWRILDSSGSGYYLDPANSGHRYTGKSNNWAQFDIGFTASNHCEHYSLLNRLLSNNGCGDSLDDFTNGESLIDVQPVLWYNLSRTLSPSREHWPVIRDVELNFDLLPFDWTASSPFEVID